MKIFRIYALLLWTAVPLLGLRYWTVWNRLSVSLITRFDPEQLERPITDVSRERAALASIGTVASIASIGTGAACIFVRRREADQGAWMWLAALYGIAGAFVWCQFTMLRYQLIGLPMNIRGNLNSVTTLGMPFPTILLSCVAGWQLWTSLNSVDG
jgi:hypothetical protein